MVRRGETQRDTTVISSKYRRPVESGSGALVLARSDIEPDGDPLAVIQGAAEHRRPAERPLVVQPDVMLLGEADAAVQLDRFGGGQAVAVRSRALRRRRSQRHVLELT